MASFKKSNMSKINSQMRQLKSATNKFEREANRAINELKSIERKTKSYQSKLRSSSIRPLTAVPSLYLGRGYEEETAPSIHEDYEKNMMYLSLMHQKIKMLLHDRLQKFSDATAFQSGMMNLNCGSEIAFEEKLTKELQTAISE